MPPPDSIIRASARFSKTLTSRPARRRPIAAVRPPIPAPTMIALVNRAPRLARASIPPSVSPLCEHAFVPYVELHCHSAYSFLDGASHPLELAGAAAEQGHEALALTDHDGLHGAMEMAHALKPLGIRPITGAELTLDDGSHLTLLCESREGYTNLCRLITAAHWHTRRWAREGWSDPTAQVIDGRRPGQDPLDEEPSVTLAEVERCSAGLVCLSGCARDGAVAARVEAGDHPGAAAMARRLLRIFGPDRLRIELQRPYWQGDRRRNRLLGRAGRAPGRALRGHRQRARPHARAHPAPGRDGRRAPGRHARRDRAQAPRQLLPRAGPARADGPALSRAPRRGGRDAAPGRAPALRPDRGPRLPLPRLRGSRRRPQAGRAVLVEARGALPARRGRGAPGGGAARDPPPRAVGLLPAAPRHARAGPRGGLRGARDGLHAAAAAARAGEGVERLLDRLLPHRPLAHRPDRERAAAGALPQRGDHRAAGHRPRLPARHPRRPDPARARPLRARPLRAGGRLLDLPGALGGARLRQGAGPAAGRDRAPGPGGGSLEGPQRHRGRGAAARRTRPALAALGRPGQAGPRRLGAAAPPVPAPGRHGHLHPAADRPLPGAAGLDGGAADGAVGQGLLRRRRLPQDRPAGPGDAVGGRALRGRDRARARRADRPVAHPLRRPAGLRPHPGRRDDGRVPDRVARADADAQAHPAREPRRHHRAGGAGAPGADHRRRRAPVHRAPQGAAREPRFRGAVRAPVARAGAALHAGHDRLPGPGARGCDGLRRLPRRGGRGAAAGDEPKALGGGDPGLRGEVRGRRDGARRHARVGRARLVADRGLLGLRLPQGALGRLRPARLPVHLAARALPPGVPLRPAQRAADGLLPARLAGARGPAQGGRDPASQRGGQRRLLPRGGLRRAASVSAT